VIGKPFAVEHVRDASRSAVRSWVEQTVRHLVCDLDGVASVAEPLERFRVLSALGRTDLVLARLVEGHLDAAAILAEAMKLRNLRGSDEGADEQGSAMKHRSRQSGPCYGVWASASGGTGLTAREVGGRFEVSGTMRFCSGATFLDRALVTARIGDDGSTTARSLLLLDIDLRDPLVQPLPGTWPALGMDASESLDVHVAGLTVPVGAQVGPPGFYVERPGLHLGGIGVAAVWLGGAQGDKRESIKI